MTVVELASLGRKYMKLWPERAELIQYFDEYRAVVISRFVYRYFPALAVVGLVFSLYLGSFSTIPQSLIYSLFMLSMPLQAMVMLGVKADKHLPPSLASWYKQGVARFNEQGGSIKLSFHKPRYLDLARLLNLTYQQKKFD